ncbi:NADH-ubiquinone oxidoreductase [Grosmannia clavigera kw1407]|uniref:NADH dehydrogenase [ubiquinone] iron-sulfur protein 4, mitochondrial n=1 Tax=Grosmannia clavigera (strain kw1407 / UAMH 11150) TaxID=655863 RepID=F0XER7_GROCL|nr:NADH-ubiquinone oxidoreductase [Grosmannia clavigera kw1407]EFX03994.1 NADH-ubiquinone oxidoreductase [Grosmannia clavigera kw1407]
MAAFRPVSTAAAARLLRSSAAVPNVRRPLIAAAPAMRRFESSLTSAPESPTVSDPSTLATSKNQPDYAAHSDRATSKFTPVPKRLLDGSEDTDVLPAAVLSGAPMELEARQVRIYKPAKPATQSGTWGGSHWRMDWDVLSKGHRWENPLMGWQSSADFMQGTHINFKSKEDAIAFAEKQGYEYFVQEPKERSFRPKQYASQFMYSDKKLKQVRTK